VDISKNNTLAFIDKVILFSFYFILPLDNLNGLLSKTFMITISISLIFKFYLIVLLTIRFLFYNISFYLLWIFLISAFTIGSIIPLNELSLAYLFKDISFNLKFILAILIFNYFKDLLQSNKISMEWIHLFFKYSLTLVTVNLLLGLVGLGYPQYVSNGIKVGYIGFFYSGNELSALIIVLFLYFAYKSWISKNYKQYIALFSLGLILAFLKSTKTTILGVILIFLIVPFINKKYLDQKILVNLLATIQIFIPIIAVVTVLGLFFTNLYARLAHNWQKLDFLTFLFSTRNKYAVENYKIFNEHSFISKLFGTGYSKLVNVSTRTVEIDIVDILIFNGYLGCFLFLSVLFYYINLSRKQIKKGKFPFSNLILFSIFILFIISVLAGHVFTSGLAVVYIGILFSTLFYEKRESI